MRLIDADEFKVQIAGMTVLDDYPPSMVNALHELIDRQPTVRDTEKAVEELKDLKLAYYLTIANRRFVSGNRTNGQLRYQEHAGWYSP